ncbi:ATP-grasp domain-containing protein [Lignipirellula cremea]|uniref:ATP-grasp domain-containing protein n=1 Tax=Lignipirellula cremea TaxID=2528010 RepID=A0A518DPC9_9BACT|nr:ATP-grasp domain-containing protein [Lignipirellula cremea]QDU93700.1 hypothetical protein Pla8534_14810 [Lignipirellula cremea]
MTTLLMSSRHTEDDQALWRAAIGRGWTVVRAQGIRLPEIDDSEVVIYVETLFATTIARQIGCRLPDLPVEWLVQLPHAFRQREITLGTPGQARQLDRPSFVKPPNDKSFAARIFDSGASLPLEFEDDVAVLVAQPVLWETEFRCFCLDGSVQTLSPYLRSGAHAQETDYHASDIELREATRFAEQVLAATKSFTPRAVVIDVGQIAGKGWAVVEANAAWGSGIYGCDPDLVLDVIRHATIQPAQRGE